jgi:hypothetical protein
MIGPESISGATVHHEVHGGAVGLGAGRDRARVRVEALERWQESRVDVEHAALPLRHEPGREQPHESCEADQLDAMCLQHRLQRALERLAILAEARVIDDLGRNAGRARMREPGCIGTVGDDERDLGRIVRRPRGLDQRSHVGAAPGNEDGDALPRHRVTRHRVTRHRVTTRGRGVRHSSPAACRP